ncbi:hypothetical protein [Jiella sonneratiae]|uniref:Uncharacterized protein n=1 Tax=Jiella sonneratiae TaxID=2816856 RepID=A0ABS3IZ51_9HYPH|nr:hypothetical protein [Jiella sonneratiae]MBO0902682.1 hypothetical protein [Jiella sonneratiae]
MTDRLQAAWRYAGAEIWRPLFKRFATSHPDLPIEVVRTALDRPHGSPAIFVARGRKKPLDRLREDVATLIDQPTDSRAALRRIKSDFFLNGRSVAILLSDVATALAQYESAEIDDAYRERVVDFLRRHELPYRLDTHPFRLVPLLHGEIDSLYAGLRVRADRDVHLREALAAFETAWARQSAEWNQHTAKDAIRMASLLAENMLVSASAGRENEFSRALNRMRREDRFPSNDFANIFDRAYTFANTYPNIRHPGNADCVKRLLRKEDTLIAALLFVGLSACAHDLCE